MHIRDIRMLYAYNTWANTRILDAVAQVPAEHFTMATLGTCNLRDTLEHILVAESVWRLRWQGIRPASVEFPDEFSSLDAICAQWRKENQQLEAFLATLSDADLERTVTGYRDDGTTSTWPLWHVLLHVVNHGTQHRAELALLLTGLGHSPGDVDLTVFLREQP